MVSQNLVDWTYVGESFSAPPSWAEPDAALWAPDVVYSSTFDQYYMFVVVTDTTSAVSGVEECASDSAIGVATSAGPDRPVDLLRHAGRRPTAGRAGCNFLWTYDPDVLGDTVADSGILYYGSYYGGIYGTTPAADRRRRDSRHRGRHDGRHRQQVRGRQRRREGRLLLPVRSPRPTAATVR